MVLVWTHFSAVFDGHSWVLIKEEVGWFGIVSPLVHGHGIRLLLFGRQNLRGNKDHEHHLWTLNLFFSSFLEYSYLAESQGRILFVLTDSILSP